MRIALIAVVAALFNAQAFAAEAVTFPSADGTTIQARLFLPAGAGPFPAVVALHGCGGPNNQRGQLAARHAEWAERLTGAGFMVLMPDSFGSRGLGQQCTERVRAALPGRERRADTIGARRWLQARPDVIAARVSLLGWSHGGSTVLYATGQRARPPQGEVDYARAVAFYPGCRVPLEQSVVPRIPLLILMGEADNWTPIEPCRALVAQAKARGATVELVAYPSAFHGFDDRTSRVRQRTGLAFTADGSGNAMVGHDPAAASDAFARVPAFLRQ